MKINQPRSMSTMWVLKLFSKVLKNFNIFSWRFPFREFYPTSIYTKTRKRLELGWWTLHFWSRTQTNYDTSSALSTQVLHISTLAYRWWSRVFFFKLLSAFYWQWIVVMTLKIAMEYAALIVWTIGIPFWFFS